MSAIALAALAHLALVSQNRVPLRIAPHDSAATQAVLWQGDSLEVRGERLDYLAVFDPRSERAGYVKASQVREITLAPESAQELLAVVRFLRDAPGAEALGVAYASAYLRAVPAQAVTAEPFDALGTFADRLASRASMGAAHLEVVAQYGIGMRSFERDGAIQICSDGEMYRRALALAPDPRQSARAALGLTRHECVDPAWLPGVRYQWNLWRAQVLEQVPLASLSPSERNRLHLRRAGVWAAIAYAQARRDEPPQRAGARAVDELAAVIPQELSDEDRADYTDAAVRVGSSRWAAEPVARRSGIIWIQAIQNAPGETCVLLLDARHDARNPLARRCTYSVVWMASATANASGSALALAVQPLETWRELWVFRHEGASWKVDVLPPGESSVDLGYIEYAGWVPVNERLLTVSEVKTNGMFRRRFAVRRLDTLAVENQATRPGLLTLFKKWQAVQWRRDTLALR